ncbi:uncharacterized protein TNCT_687821 [Trichonephila clavata]|uniref:Uncharacterized protein n=1 Tax=Trichonephila clavata TaxID=2740835 RepID=A0A8X6KYH9_TRICU|nr:uncharacterized protein TNCT_687821 [Trichonephila clavata]
MQEQKAQDEKKQNPKWLKEFVIRFYSVPQNQHDLQVQNWLTLTQRCGLFYGSVSNSSRTDRYQMVQVLKPTDKPLRKNFCVKFQEKLDGNSFENTLVFTDEATFHLCGKVNRHNLRFWGTENVHVTLEH